MITCYMILKNNYTENCSCCFVLYSNPSRARLVSVGVPSKVEGLSQSLPVPAKASHEEM